MRVCTLLVRSYTDLYHCSAVVTNDPDRGPPDYQPNITKVPGTEKFGLYPSAGMPPRKTCSKVDQMITPRQVAEFYYIPPPYERSNSRFEKCVQLDESASAIQRLPSEGYVTEVREHVASIAIT